MTGALNRHSKLHGNDLADPAGKSFRGQRAFCSNRARRGGCGRTVSIFLHRVLPRHTLTAALFWQVLRAMLGGASLQSAAQALPLAVDTFRGACRRLRGRLDAVRTALCGAQRPAPSNQALPLRQTLEHLQAVFPHSAVPFEDYQSRFQLPLMG